MTQQPFSRPGAFDLSALRRPAQQPASAASVADGGAPLGAYTVEVTQENFQSVLESSMTAAVVLVFHSPSRAPETTTYAHDVAATVEAYDGRFLAALIDIDAVPQIAQAMQIPSVPLMLVLLDGRPASQPIPGLLQPEEVSGLLDQLSQQLTANGVTARHQPRSGAAPAAEGDEPAVDPRYAPAQDALESGDIDLAVAEYQKLVDGNPADTEAAAGLAMAKVLQRTAAVTDLTAARTAAAENPDDIDAQTLVADLDLLGGHVEDAFNRLVALVARSVGDDRARARDHLLGLFAAVGNEDPRVLRGRQNLASALF